MNPETGKFLTESGLAEQFKAPIEDAMKRAEQAGWMPLAIGEVIKIKGNDFRVVWIGSDAFLLQSVKVARLP